MIATVAVSGYRSLRDVAVPLSRLTVITGPNGSGKSNLYRALRLLADCGQGRVISSLAREGGLQSVLWAGPESLRGARRSGGPVQGTRRSGPVSLLLGVGSDDLGYLVDLGLPVQSPGASSHFLRDPEIKREVVFAGPVMRPRSVLAQRQWSRAALTDGLGGLTPSPLRLGARQSLLTELGEPTLAAPVWAMRRALQEWRFYDGFRTDPLAPARQAQVGSWTPVLADDGADLAAAVQTILELGGRAVQSAVADAFDGAHVKVANRDGWFELLLHQPGMLRPLTAAELSDGTLRYLLWCAALLTVEPPPLMVINEPETSLHPTLIGPLARLVVAAAAHTQVVLVTHSASLRDELGYAVQLASGAGDALDLTTVGLRKDLGETLVDDQGLLTRPTWEWGRRQQR